MINLRQLSNKYDLHHVALFKNDLFLYMIEE